MRLPIAFVLLALGASACGAAEAAPIETTDGGSNPPECPKQAPPMPSSCALDQGTSCRYADSCSVVFYICNRGAWLLERQNSGDPSSGGCQPLDAGSD